MKTPKAIMDAAKGEPCTINTEFCNYDNETTVGCHLPDGSGGSSRLTGPLSLAFGCSGCHDAIDGRNYKGLLAEEKDFYMRRGMMRTINRLIEMGLVTVKGLK